MELSYETAKAGLLKLAAERPSYIHPNDPKVAETQLARSTNHSCFYRFSDGTPGCLVGALAADLFPDLRIPEGETASYALREAGVGLDSPAAELLEYAQGEQDLGRTWVVAVNRAIQRAEM